MSKITRVSARQILDSRSVPTIEVSVTLDSGTTAYSSSPSGGIVNKLEALELRDHNPNEYFGLGVSQAVHLVNTEIAQRLIGMDPLYQNQIDQALIDLDGTPNKARLGGNSILATSQAVMKTAALSLNLPLYVYIKEKYRLIQDFRVPTPIFNLINGGRHGSGSLDFQEFQVVPASHLPYRQALKIGVEIFLSLERVLEQKGAIRAVGLEGGFSPNLATNTDALEIMFEACQGTSYTLSQDAFLGIDVSPQNFQKGGRFLIKDKNEPLTAKQLIKFFQDLHSQFRVFAFEDALLPDAWSDWKFLTAELGSTAMIIADDLVATNKTLLLKAIEEKACNSIVIKPNRVGTVTETVEAISLAKQAGWHTVLSHRSGETNDDFIADLAVGVGTEYVKFGATSRGERVEKYNRLLRIQEQLEEWQAGTPEQIQSVTTPELQPLKAIENFAPVVASITPNKIDNPEREVQFTPTPEINVAAPETLPVEPVLTPIPAPVPEPLPEAPPVVEATASPQPEEIVLTQGRNRAPISANFTQPVMPSGSPEQDTQQSLNQILGSIPTLPTAPVAVPTSTVQPLTQT